MIKEPGGLFRPVNDMEYEKTTKFKNSEQYSIDVKLTRTPKFHRKVFAFFNFCFEHWRGSNEFQNESKQFDVFRNNLTVIAGYYDSFYSISGEVRIEAKSLSYSNMPQDDFEQLYNALIQAAMAKIFKSCDESVYDKLIGFF